jgi:competence protein ComEA
VRIVLSDHGRLPMDQAAVGAAAAVPPLAGAAPRQASAGPWARLLARVPVRVDPGRRTALAVGAAVLIAAVVTGAWVLAARPRALAVSSTPAPIAGASSPGGTAAARSPAPPRPASELSSSTSAALVVVDVAGKVRRPGLYRLRPGSRVDDAVRAAGGALAGVKLDSLNLAAKVVDGQQISVGVPAAGGGGAGGPVPSGGSGGAGPPAQPVDLNTATLGQLETLPGVGPVLAQHVLDWRAAHGGFASVDQLDDVAGIGDVKFAALKPLVTV